MLYVLNVIFHLIQILNFHLLLYVSSVLNLSQQPATLRTTHNYIVDVLVVHTVASYS